MEEERHAPVSAPPKPYRLVPFSPSKSTLNSLYLFHSFQNANKSLLRLLLLLLELLFYLALPLFILTHLLFLSLPHLLYLHFDAFDPSLPHINRLAPFELHVF